MLSKEPYKNRIAQRQTTHTSALNPPTYDNQPLVCVSPILFLVYTTLTIPITPCAIHSDIRSSLL